MSAEGQQRPRVAFSRFGVSPASSWNWYDSGNEIDELQEKWQDGLNFEHKWGTEGSIQRGMHYRCTAVIANGLKANSKSSRNAVAAKCRGINDSKKMDHSLDTTDLGVPSSSFPPENTVDALIRRFAGGLHAFDHAQRPSWLSMRLPTCHANVPRFGFPSPVAVPYPLHFLQPVGPFFTPRYLNLRTFAAVPGMDQAKHGRDRVEEASIGANKRARANSGSAAQKLPDLDSDGFLEVPFEFHPDDKPKSQIFYARGSVDSKGEVKCTKLSVEELEMASNRLRNWDRTEVGLKQLESPNSGMEFSLMSYNVLAQCLLEENQYLYDHCYPDILHWDYRKSRLLKEFQWADADVLCLQEVQSEHFDEFFVPELEKLGYSGIYKKRTGNKNDGCAIFYKNALFVMDSSISIEYCRPGVSILDRDNIALVAMLRPKGSRGGKQKVCVANTHLLFNPGRGDIKLAQLRILLAEIDKFAFHRLSRTQRPLYHPVIMCGDMNSEPDCPLYKFVGTGALHYEGLVAGDISGQAEGMFRGRFFLNKELVPRTLGISDQCQYIETLCQRIGNILERSGPADVVAAVVETEKKVHLAFGQQSPSSENGKRTDVCPSHTEVQHLPSVTNEVEATPTIVVQSPVASPERQPLFSSGKMTHRLNLVSAYDHYLDRLPGRPPAVTTHHRKASCTVDYIFYSVHSKRSSMKRGQVVHRDMKEGLLSLLATYGLLSEDELRALGGLPNAALPSDHLPLMAKFLLRKS